MSLIPTASNNLTTLKTSNMQSLMVSNRLILGIIAFSVSFGLSLVPNWNFKQSLITAIITVLATYTAALFVDQRRRNHEMLVLSSLHKRIKDMEGLKSRIVREINQIETHRDLLYKESQQLQNQILECRNQRNSLHRELGSFAGQKKQLEDESNKLKTELYILENNQVELNHSLTTLTAEKRRLELHCNAHRSEINQMQSQISELQQEKQEIESNLTLLGRLKPQLEEKLYELRIALQDLETEVNQQSKLLVDTAIQKDDIAASLDSLKKQRGEQQTELQQLKSEVSLLQEERDLLQSQVWELLQQTEILNQDLLPGNIQPEKNDLLPFSEVVESLPEEWTNFLEKLPSHEIQVLKAIVEQDNPSMAIKKIAEDHITMPNLLIDSINECANDTIGELIIEPSVDIPEVYQEHIVNVRKLLSMYEVIMTRHASPN
ncbi:tellurite resistance TerB C-terminal domain-containing protein [Halotia branconii]|uniref:Tellurite resistance TerB C-terminal domain-containing protein n=1 Tax=Halotia branconii CENA392 TaxID=1539056 RepID=A0AAJ6NNJ7_9CYAN|nr:tellurite resistance TerB C-terminal domain-containing protein [Halotia branconii]WGV23678.1 tellurite resistance TerB C-terminal domain-containing protein [Halotia branconii CENA392]